MLAFSRYALLTDIKDSRALRLRHAVQSNPQMRGQSLLAGESPEGVIASAASERACIYDWLRIVPGPRYPRRNGDGETGTDL